MRGYAINGRALDNGLDDDELVRACLASQLDAGQLEEVAAAEKQHIYVSRGLLEQSSREMLA